MALTSKNIQASVPELFTEFAPAERTDRQTLFRQHEMWIKQEQTRLIGDAVPNLVLILNNNRQIVYANARITMFGKYKTVKSYLGLRPGELVKCQYAFKNPGGCGTTRFCKDCGAANAILTSLIGKKDAEECSIFRNETHPALELRVLTTPVQLNGEDFVIFAIEDIYHEKENQRLLQKVQQLATEDPLTGVPNRRAFFEEAEREFRRMVRYQRKMSVIMFDLDKFKTTNDTLGHPVGDAVLKAVALCIRANLRELDLFGRYGGDEFIALLPETDLGQGLDVANRIVEAVSLLEVESATTGIHPSITSGVSDYDPEDLELEDIIARADANLLRHKLEKHYKAKK